MKIVVLTKEQFDAFSMEHPLHTYYQTSMYGDLQEKLGYKSFYYGFVNDAETLIGATMLYTGTLYGQNKFAYAPRGFLIDYEDKDLLQELSYKFKNYLAKQKIVFLKIDPPVINNKRDHKGNIIPSDYSSDLIPFLTSRGYSYFGENKFFGTLKPRWNAILKVTGSSATLFKNLDNNVRNKIRKAQSRGIQIIQGNLNDIDIFYSFVKKKHNRNLSYYKKLAEAFSNNLELYFAKLDSNEYLKSIKSLYEKELENNDLINNKIQEAGLNNSINKRITNAKLTSDKLLATYKKELVYATKLFEANPNGVIIGASAIIRNPYGISLLIEGIDKNYGLFYPTYLIKWHVIEKYAKQGAIYIDLNAITGDFSNTTKFKGLNEMKLGYNADVIEYIGEFDLIIKQSKYDIYRKFNFLQKKVTNKK